MPAIITNKFRIHNSEQFKESFSEAAGNIYYLGIGEQYHLILLQEEMVEQTIKVQMFYQLHQQII